MSDFLHFIRVCLNTPTLPRLCSFRHCVHYSLLQLAQDMLPRALTEETKERIAIVLGAAAKMYAAELCETGAPPPSRGCE